MDRSRWQFNYQWRRQRWYRQCLARYDAGCNGTVRATGFIAGTGGITLGGVTYTSWTSAGTNYWLNNTGSNVGISTTQAVGIGTTFVGGVGEAALSVMNGNVGIGTWTPTATLMDWPWDPRNYSRWFRRFIRGRQIIEAVGAVYYGAAMADNITS